jgi:hypothetical protein
MAKRWMLQKRLKQKAFRTKARGILRKYDPTVVNGQTPNAADIEWHKRMNRDSWVNGVSCNELSAVNSTKAETVWKELTLKNARPEWLFVNLRDDEFLRARLYFRHDPYRCCVIEWPRRRPVRRSILYRSREVCVQRWLSSTLDWAEDSRHPDIPETLS